MHSSQYQTLIKNTPQCTQRKLNTTTVYADEFESWYHNLEVKLQPNFFNLWLLRA